MKCWSLVFQLLVIGAHAAFAQGTVTLSPDDPAYRDIDRLIDRNLVTHVIVGQRPYSRIMMARIAREAALRLDSSSSDAVARSLDSAAIARLRLVGDPGPGVDSGDARQARAWPRTRAIRAEVLSTDLESLTVPSNGLGFIEADVNTLTHNRFGERFATGTNLSVDSEHWLELPARVGIQVRPRAWLHGGRGAAPSGVSGELLAASARAVRGNLAVTAGREYTLWSTGDAFGLFFSPNAPALDLVRIASDVPFVLPSVFRLLGDAAATLQVANLGRSMNNSHSVLVSYKVSIKPARDVEFGAAFMNHFGGAGAQGTGALNRFVDLVPLLDVFRQHADSTDVVSDKLLGTDARIRLSRLANVTVFGEVALEDFDIHRLHSIFHEDAAYTLGVLMPTLPLPSLSARIAYHTTGVRFYEHHLITNGIAARRFTLGDDLGHDAWGGSALLRWEGASGAALTATADIEERRNDRFGGGYTNAGQQKGLVFVRVEERPAERRGRVVIAARFTPMEGMTLQLAGGAERVSNFGFVASAARIHGVASAGAAFYPGWPTR